MQSILLCLGLLAAAVPASPVEQQPLRAGIASPAAENPENGVDLLGSTTSKGLHGRFLHVTDLHLDPHYKPGTLIDDSSCHSGDGSAGYFGSEGTDCDSPYSLVNETFRWIEEHLKDEIDFVIWTGDSARHDNDENMPRSPEEVLELNEIMAQKWIDLFGAARKAGDSKSASNPPVPVVPTIGNNDIMPHNIFRDGPNRWTKRLAQVWRKFIPEDQRHSFVEGGWFTTEVIPGRLAAISLNTMYFYESNTAVDGCEAKSQPGYEHMEWLRVQLQLLRDRKMKAILVGHVPPARSSSKQNWDETCWQKYTLWMDRYRDVVVGGLYGHMNIDHFMFQDSDKVEIDAEPAQKSTNGTVSVASKEEYLDSLRELWADLPSPPSGIFDFLDEEFAATGERNITIQKSEKKKDKKRKEFIEKIGGPWAERYSVSLVAPSLVPNYFPALRVIEYNITGVEHVIAGADTDVNRDDTYSDASARAYHVDPGSLKAKSRSSSPKVLKKKKHKKKKKHAFTPPDPPSPTAPPGPAYSNQAFTWLSFEQYFANLTRLNEEAENMRKGHKPRVDFEMLYSTNDEAYQMKDLTVRSFFQLATTIAEEEVSRDDNRAASNPTASRKKSVNDVWRAFLYRAFVGLVDPDELDD